MLSVSGLGVTKVRQIHEALGIDSLPELEAAARDGRLARLPRFGPKTAENITRSIAFLRQTSGVRLAHHAAEEAETLRQALAGLPGVRAGGSRRGDPPARPNWSTTSSWSSWRMTRPEDLFGRLAALPGRPRVRRT